MVRAARRAQRRRADPQLRRERLSGAHRGRSQGSSVGRRRRRRRRSQTGQTRQPVASICARSRRTSVCRRWHPADRGGCDAVGHRGWHRNDGRHLRRTRRGAERRSARRGTGTRSAAQRARLSVGPADFLPQPVGGRPCAADARVRNARLRKFGAYRVRLRRAGGRYRAEADSARRGGPCARRRLRLDDQSGRARRLLPAERRVGGQRHPRAGEPSVRCHAQRLRARRRRRVPGARGLGHRRAGVARASTPSWRATAIRCRAIASPTRTRPETDRYRRCTRRSPTPVPRSPMSTT